MKECFCKSSPNSTGFSIEHYEKEHTINFISVETFKNLTLLKCSDCETLWLLENESLIKFCHKIYSNSQLELLKEWKLNDLSASHLKDYAGRIGFSSNEFIEIPCKATLADNTILDFCILSKWTHHPLISWQSIKVRKFIYADKVIKIEPSEFSLSLTHRKIIRTLQAEIYSGIIPLILKINNDLYFNEQGGKNFYFETNFLRFENFKGVDVTEINQETDLFKEFHQKDNLTDEITLILFNDW